MDDTKSEEDESIAAVVPKKLRTCEPDVTVVVGRGDKAREFCHYSVVLMFSCDYFDAMLSNKMKECREMRITFPYILLISLTALAGGILNTFERFLVPALTPALLNISLITAAILFSARLEVPVMALAWGVLAAGLMQLFVQVPALMRLGVMPRPRWGWRHSGVRKVMRLMIPTLIGSSVAQVNLLFDVVIATFLVSGSVSWLYYSDRLLEFPLGVFGVALSTVILPNLSRKFARQDPQAFSHTLDWALRLAMIITLPAAIGLAVLAAPILITLFQYGSFGANDVEMSALSLSAYAAGLPAFIAVKVLAPGFYARQDTKTPVKISIASLLANIVLNIVIVVPMLRAGVVGAHAGLALATSLASALNLALLVLALRKKLGSLGWRGIAQSALKTLGSAVVMGATVWVAAKILIPAQGAPFIALLAGVMACVVAGLAVFGGCSYGIKSPEMDNMLAEIKMSVRTK